MLICLTSAENERTVKVQKARVKNHIFNTQCLTSRSPLVEFFPKCNTNKPEEKAVFDIGDEGAASAEAVGAQASPSTIQKE